MARFLLLISLALLLAASAPAAVSVAPHLRMVRVSPVTIGGRHFKAGERVRLVLTSGGATWNRFAGATGAGSFVAAFSIRLGHCSGFKVTATGAGGSRAVLKRPPLPACISQ